MAFSIQTLVQPSLYSKSGMWNLGDIPKTFSTTGSEVVSTSMAYQYPTATSGLEPQNMIPSFHHPPLDHTQQSSAQGPLSPGIKTSGSLAPSKSTKIKRSMSTPNVRGQASADAAALALSADKRRNKLGYHRTSVACGHCRRRKIRCIPAPADPQNRCSNCIRLKKECNFYPVDQQPQPDQRRGGSKTNSGTGRASESSSPSTSSGQLPEISSTLPYPPLSMPPIQDLGGPQMKRQRTESFSPENKGGNSLNPRRNNFPDKVAVVTSSRNFEYNHGATNWMAPDASPSIKHQGEMPQSFWRPNPQDSPLTPAFSPFTPSLQIPPPQNWPAPQPEPSPRDDVSWSGPQRSISYSNLEGLQNHHHYTPYTNAPSNTVTDHYTTKPRTQHSGMYPPPISAPTSAVTAPTSSSMTNEATHHPHSAGPLPSTPFQTWQQPYSYQKPPGSSAEGYGAWNAPHEALPRPSGYGTEAPPPQQQYAYPEPTSGMYYPGPPHQGR
ncbi:hypothetical protein LSUE1_G001342 [Lachnellula suecica]|uniref:Zn(2)-C6 fungal-type domain-containing protein n=1 Tax=Lachnellula suecica TaxID=602035 RepID=A0A8T9CFN3_9HELO|nr:hypothetical protein LSUE1_G001342 [Lachnellula suecica]